MICVILDASECHPNSNINPTVVDQDHDPPYEVSRLLTRSLAKEEDSKNYWLPPEGAVGEAADFVLKLDDDSEVDKIKLVNTHNGAARDRSTKGFKVYLSNDGQDGPWTEVLQDTLTDSRQDDPPLLQEFGISPPREAKYVKFEITSFYGNKGGGLQYFGVFCPSPPEPSPPTPDPGEEGGTCTFSPDCQKCSDKYVTIGRGAKCYCNRGKCIRVDIHPSIQVHPSFRKECEDSYMQCEDCRYTLHITKNSMNNGLFLIP